LFVGCGVMGGGGCVGCFVGGWGVVGCGFGLCLGVVRLLLLWRLGEWVPLVGDYCLP